MYALHSFASVLRASLLFFFYILKSLSSALFRIVNMFNLGILKLMATGGACTWAETFNFNLANRHNIRVGQIDQWTSEEYSLGVVNILFTLFVVTGLWSSPESGGWQNMRKYISHHPVSSEWSYDSNWRWAITSNDWRNLQLWTNIAKIFDRANSI